PSIRIRRHARLPCLAAPRRALRPTSTPRWTPTPVSSVSSDPPPPPPGSFVARESRQLPRIRVKRNDRSLNSDLLLKRLNLILISPLKFASIRVIRGRSSA